MQVQSHFVQAPRLVGNLVKCQIQDGISPFLPVVLCHTRHIPVIFEKEQSVFLLKIPKLCSLASYAPSDGMSIFRLLWECPDTPGVNFTPEPAVQGRTWHGKMLSHFT